LDMKVFGTVLVVLAVSMFGAMLAPLASADTLNTADSFAVLAGSAVSNAGAGVLGATVITGDLGVDPGSTCSGFKTCPTTGPGTITGSLDLGNGVALTAQNDLNSAYTTLGGLAGKSEPSNLGGMTLGPGVYTVAAETLTGTLTLSDGGVAGSQFVFVLGALTTATGAKIDVSGLSPSDSVFWVIGSSATLGNNTVFDGNILALTSITFDPGATDLCGRALAENGAVSFAGQDPTSLTQNQVSIGCSANLAGSNGLAGGTATGAGGGGGNSAPEPGTLGLALVGLSGLCFMSRRRDRSRTTF
jgi:hypothetical protein